MNAEQQVFVPETPHALRPQYRAVLERALKAEAWLEALKLREIVTGITDSDMQTFAKGCERLSETFKEVRTRAHELGYAEGKERGARDERRKWIPAVLVSATVAAGAVVGVLLRML